MSTRMIRTLALAAGAGALVLGAAGPAMADDEATPNPYKFSVAKDAVDATLEAKYDPAATTSVCPVNTTWTARVPGRQDAIVPNNPVVTCVNGMLSLKVSDNRTSNKKNAVIKIVGTSTDVNVTSKIVKTFVVKVLDQSGNNGKGGKP